MSRKTMNAAGLLALVFASALAVAPTAPAHAQAGLSEKDYLADLPIVLSVSRLPQRLEETPGALTILDRQLIARSGARDVADLLRLVPGFQSSMSFEPYAPQASYHGNFANLSNRMQVLVDGRSAYSPFLIGSVGQGLQTVALSDIERIEVLRGSNSAAYGARAFLGVVNIVTRNPAETTGLSGQLAAGDNRIGDAGASVGATLDKLSYRLSLDRRADDGLQGANDHNQVNRINLRGDFRLSAVDTVELRLGRLATDAGTGLAGSGDSPLRDIRAVSNHLQLDWRRVLGAEADLRVSLSHSDESYHDRFAFSLLPLGIPDSLFLDFGGSASMDNLSLQQTLRLAPTLRAVWGGEWRREQISSRPLYNTDAALVSQFQRLFGNLEWQLLPDLLLNAGALLERQTDAADSLAPRVMLNWQPVAGHTLRAGLSRAYRPASTFEQRSEVRYYYSNPLLNLNNVLLSTTFLGTGGVQPEAMLARELGYLWQLPSRRLTLDLRLFDEQIDGIIRQSTDPVTGIKFYRNEGSFAIQGLEYQLSWQPWNGAQLSVNQSVIHNTSPKGDISSAAAQRAGTLTLLQQLPWGLDVSLLHQQGSDKRLPDSGHLDQRSISRTDLRLARRWRTDGRLAELALVLQNLEAPYPDYAPRAQFQPRAFVTLRLHQP